MKKLIRDYKRHYHRTRKLVEKIHEQGGFKFKIDSTQDRTTASTTTPDQNVTVRFAILMRRFLSPTSDLYYEKVINEIKERAPELIPEDLEKNLESYLSSMKQGPIGIKVDDEELTAEKIYSTISEGVYFENDTKASNYLEEITSHPLVGPLLIHQFYSYTLEGFYLISSIFDLILDWENSKKQKITSAEHTCIYCLQSDNTFSSEEHILPESLGNDEAVLPKGFVCDKCNNETLSVLDSYLIDFEPISLLRVQFVPYTKSGKLPKANFQNIAIERTHPRHIRITPKDKSGEVKRQKELEDGYQTFGFDFRGKKVDVIKLARSLYKVGLGFVALNQGQEVALSERFNSARDFILHETDFPNNFFLTMKVKPHAHQRVTYKNIEPGCPFVIDIFGVMFFFNLEEKPILEVNDALERFGFHEYSLKKSDYS